MTDPAQLWALLPLLAGVALFRARVTRGRPCAEALLETAVLCGVAVWIGANLLSTCDALRPTALRAAWFVAAGAAGFFLWKTRRTRPAWPRPAGAGEWMLALIAVALLAVTLLRAFVAAPATVDVLNYHLPRQLMWLQQGSLAPFLTVNDRQNMMPPLAEVLGLQFLGLTGSDRWVHFPQWLAYAGLAVALATLVRRLGGSRGAAGSAAVLGLLVPMAYHEATNAKNDLLAAFWLLCGAVQLVRWCAPDFRAMRRDALWLAAPLALAWLTKSTAMLFVPPLLLAGLWPWLRAQPLRDSARALAPAVLATLLLIAPFHLRNIAWYGTPLGEHRGDDGGTQQATAFGPRLLASTAARHAALHLTTPSPDWNARVVAAVRKFHEWIGVDPEDRRTTLWILAFDAPYVPDDETIAGAPAHFVLGLPLLVALAVGAWPRDSLRRARWLAVASLTGAALFCALLKWQPWATRLELPLFLLGIAAVVVALDGALGRGRAFASAAAISVAALAWWPGADTMSRTLWTAPTLWTTSRDFDYYRQRPREALRDAGLVDMIVQSGARNVLIQSVHDVPYPLMRRLQRRAPDLRFAGAPADGPAPDAIAVFTLGVALPLRTDYGGRNDWRLVGAGFGDGFYLPEERVRALGWWERVPDFCGWVRHLGIPLSGWEQPGVGRVSSREMPTGRGALAYDGIGRPLRLRGTVRRTSAVGAAMKLVVQPPGATATVIDCGTGERVEFEVNLPAATGPQAVDLSVNDAARGGFVFTRLQIIDGP